MQQESSLIPFQEVFSHIQLIDGGRVTSQEDAPYQAQIKQSPSLRVLHWSVNAQLVIAVIAMVRDSTPWAPAGRQHLGKT